MEGGNEGTRVVGRREGGREAGKEGPRVAGGREGGRGSPTLRASGVSSASSRTHSASAPICTYALASLARASLSVQRTLRQTSNTSAAMP